MTMTVAGYVVPPEIEAGAIEWVRGRRGHHGDFTAKELSAWLRRAGVPTGSWPAYRIADRIIQRERKLGSISFASGAWHRHPKIADSLPTPLPDKAPEETSERRTGEGARGRATGRAR